MENGLLASPCASTTLSTLVTHTLAPFYIALLEALQLAWARGFRCLEVKLGVMFQDVALNLFKEVEDYLNREWFICVSNAELYQEESGAVIVSLLADCQEQAKKVYDFRTQQPFDRQTLITKFMRLAPEIASKVFNILHPFFIMCNIYQKWKFSIMCNKCFPSLFTYHFSLPLSSSHDSFSLSIPFTLTSKFYLGVRATSFVAHKKNGGSTWL
ncbi:Uracil-DNA glycosylase [Bienertia sinuspersici]